MVAIAFAPLHRCPRGILVTGVAPVGLYTNGFILLLPYALLRWGSGRDVLLGLPLILTAYVLGIAADYTDFGEAVAGLLFALFPAVLGVWCGCSPGHTRRRRSRSSCVSASSWPASCTTPWPTTCRPSPSGPRPAASWPPPTRGRRRGAGGHRGGGIARARRDAVDGRGAARGRGRRSRPRSAASRHARSLARDDRRHPQSTVHIAGDLDDLSPSVECRGVPAGPGVDHQRPPPRPPRHAHRVRVQAADERRRPHRRRRRRAAATPSDASRATAWSGWPSGRRCSAAPSRRARRRARLGRSPRVLPRTGADA